MPATRLLVVVVLVTTIAEGLVRGGSSLQVRPRHALHASPGHLGGEVEATAVSADAWRETMANIELPEGFVAKRVSLEFEPAELPGTMARMNVAALFLRDAPTPSVAGVFTRNELRGAPVEIARRTITSASDALVRGVVVNNKVSNVGLGEAGEHAAARVCDAARAWALEDDDGDVAEASRGAFLPASTGVIGWRLPADAIVKAFIYDEQLKSEISTTALTVAEAMMTTDRYPKVASATLPTSGARVVGVAKGAGMIEPNMGTMLAFVATDLIVSKDDLDAALRDAVDRTFGCCGVDGDASTSDMVLALSSNVKRGGGGANPDDDDNKQHLTEFRHALGHVCAQLAHHVVRNGEGTNHVVRVAVRGCLARDREGAARDREGAARDRELARALGRFVVNGLLLKTCVAGNDPNVGRIVARVGQFLSLLQQGGRRRFDDDDDEDDEGERTELSLDRCAVSLGGKVVFRDGVFRIAAQDDSESSDSNLERDLVKHLRDAQLGPDDVGLPGCSSGDAFPRHGKCVEILIDFSDGRRPANDDDDVFVLGSDLTHQYVTENADYRS